MDDREQIIKYAEERLSKLHPDEKDKDHIGLMVTSGWLKEVVKLLNQDAGKVLFYEQTIKLKNCNNCGGKKTCEYCPKPGGPVVFNCPLWEDGDHKGLEWYKGYHAAKRGEPYEHWRHDNWKRGFIVATKEIQGVK